ncbi:MAG TPA: methionine aminotransferase [Bacteroidia bacterium]|nr:methionine aminotransferase [Bacteroidia bacterium]
MANNTVSIASKLPKQGTTIFTVMSALAKEQGAVNLAQGFPDFECPPALVDLVTGAMKNHHNQYAPMPGVLALREKIAEKTFGLYSHEYHPDTEITITPGATLALWAAITAVVREGDEVIVIEPAYDSYVPAILVNGGRPVFTSMKFPEYRIDWEEVKKLVTFKTRMIIINTPHNPTGTVMSSADMEKLQKITEGTDIIIVSDEVYEHILFDGREHQSVARYPKLAARSFIISSFGKTFHTTGWKIGYCLAPAPLMAEFRKIYQFMAFSTNTPMQYAIAEFLNNDAAWREVSEFYQQKRNLFTGLLKSSKFKLYPCCGSYFQLAGYDKISNEKDTEFAIRLTKEHKIASIPVSVFTSHNEDNKVLRFCFAKTEDTLEKAAEILCSIRGKY